MSWTDLRFLIDRSSGLIRRGMASLRTRGLLATWQRVTKQFQRVPAAQRASLYLPSREEFAPFSLPAHSSQDGAPKASIVIPVFNQFAHTHACLLALVTHPPRTSFEVIIVDDGSSDETETSLKQVQGLRYHRRARNGGFIASCNDGAAIARGDYLVFLNNDTIPQPGWLDTLLQTFNEHAGTGLVGAQLLYPDGRLQEAGGVVWNEGSADKLGRMDSPEAPQFRFVRRVDYVSGAALAIPRALFTSLGAFDSRYAPAFYEDTDLAMRVRALGLSVLVQPASQVIHLEGVTTGRDVRRGVKNHQPRNQLVFSERWQEVLPSHPAHGTPFEAVTDRHYQRIVLVIDALTPQPDRDSGSLRLFNLMRILREEGAHVVFMPANHKHGGHYTAALQQIGIEVWYAPFAGRAPYWLRQHGDRLDTAIVCRHYVAREFLPLLRRHAPHARIVFDTVDLHFVRERRGAELAGDTRLLRASERTRELELAVIRQCDATLVVSEAERDLLRAEAPQARVEVLSNLHEVAGPGLPFAQRHDLVFVGGFRHPPNVDAVRWFASEVFPRIREQLPQVTFHCIGGDVPPEIAALAGQSGIEVHGHLPDIRPYMDGARVALAPLRYGAGVKGKVNLSMAHGQPVVATNCAVEGMHLRPGEDVLVADDAEAFAQAVVSLHQDETLWRTLSVNGLRNVEQHFSLDAGRDVVRRVLLARD